MYAAIFTFFGFLSRKKRAFYMIHLVSVSPALSLHVVQTGGWVVKRRIFEQLMLFFWMDVVCIYLHIQPFKVGCSHGIHCIPLSPLVSSKKRVSDETRQRRSACNPLGIRTL